MRMVEYIWLGTLLTDNLLPFVLARFYPRFRAKEMALSVLGARQSPVKTVYNLWCIVSGAVFCASLWRAVAKARSRELLCAAGCLVPDGVNGSMRHFNGISDRK